MGDQGKLYVNEDVVPAYKRLLRNADLILPNQFEAEYVSPVLLCRDYWPLITFRLLSEVKITSFSALAEAVTKLHTTHRIPHIIVTSVSFDEAGPTLSVVGSTARANGSPRLFTIDVPALDCFFSGTGDMFAALTVVRLREAVTAANLNDTMSWLSPDDVDAVDLPLAKAAEKVLASMHAVLEKTKNARDEALKAIEERPGSSNEEKDSKMRIHLRKTKAAEVKLIRNVEDLRQPKIQYRAQPLQV